MEPFTVGLTHDSIKPIFRSLLLSLFLFRGPASHLSPQARQNIVVVQGVKRGGFRPPTSHEVLNPHEKPTKANGWLLTTWLQRGNHFSLILMLSR